MTNALTHDVQFLLNDGAGSFSLDKTSLAAVPGRVAVGRVNHDDFADVIVALPTANQVVFFLNSPHAPGEFVDAGTLDLPGGTAGLGHG